MGYLQALQLLTRAYKAARGVMPKGLDLLKLKQKARQKVIDSKKVINVDFSKGRKFYEEGIGDLIQKGKLFVGKAPKTKKIKEAVDPKLIQQESIKDVYKRLMRSNREAVKGFKKRNEAKKDLGDRLKDYKGDPDAMREGGIISLANGGLTNISQTYDNNPTLQAQYPNKQDYLDLFSSQTTTTTPQTNTTTQSTTSTIAPINPIKPIIKIPQGSGDGGGITNIKPRASKEPLTFRESMAQLNLQRGVPVEEEEISFFDKIKQFSPTYQFMKAGKQLKDRGQQAIEDFLAAREAAKAAEVARIARQNLAASMGSDAGPGEGAGTFGASVNEATGARGSGTGFSDYS
jgi:hypothetical protein